MCVRRTKTMLSITNRNSSSENRNSSSERNKLESTTSSPVLCVCSWAKTQWPPSKNNQFLIWPTILILVIQNHRFVLVAFDIRCLFFLSWNLYSCKLLLITFLIKVWWRCIFFIFFDNIYSCSHVDYNMWVWVIKHVRLYK